MLGTFCAKPPVQTTSTSHELHKTCTKQHESDHFPNVPLLNPPNPLCYIRPTKMTLSLSIVVPAYNEGMRLAKSLRTIVTYLNENVTESELIVVDDGSVDDTAGIARKELADSGSVHTSVISYKSNLGKGRAVRLGLQASRAEIALFTDTDLSTPITEAPKLIDPISRGECDVAFGSRALDRSLIGLHQSWRREQGGRVFNLAVRLATGLPFWDTQCGFKAFRMRACRPIIEGATIDRFGFDVPDLDAFVARLRADGVTIDAAPHPIPGTQVRSALVTDPLGDSIEITQGLAGALK